MDHEKRVYAWLEQVVRDVEADLKWAMERKDLAEAHEKFVQIQNYCSLALIECGREKADWLNENARKREEARMIGQESVKRTITTMAKKMGLPNNTTQIPTPIKR